MDEGYTINAVILRRSHGYAGGSSILDSGGKLFCRFYATDTDISQAIDKCCLLSPARAIFGVILFCSLFLSPK